MSIDDTDRAGEYPVQEVSMTVNGEEVAATVEPRLKLADFLRDTADLNSVRVGCEHGACGACTVEVDGDLVKSCMMHAVQADGSTVSTMEDLASGETLHPIQEAFHEEHALQCGFCTGGFVMATRTLLEENPDPSRKEIKEALSSSLCRCTGYQNIFEAVESAAEKLEGED